MGEYSKDASNELTHDEIKNLVKEAKDIGAETIPFFGGEPCLREDIFKIIRTASQIIPDIRLDTNGNLIDGTFARKLKKAGLKKVYISLLGHDARTHNSFTGTASFDKVVDAVKACLNQRITTDISTVATKENANSGALKKVIRLGKKLGVNGVRVLYPTCSGHWKNKYDVLLSDSEKTKVSSLVDGKFVYVEVEGFKRNYCSAIYRWFYYVSPYGDVQPCCFIPITLGNIRKEPLKDIIIKFRQHPFFAKKELYGEDYCMMRDVKLLSSLNVGSKQMIKLNPPGKLNKLFSKLKGHGGL